MFQPKFTGGFVPAGSQSISSYWFCPTSPMTSAPVSASKLNFHGLRRPYAQISGRAPAVRVRVVGRDRVRPRPRRRRVDAEQLAEQGVERLPVAARRVPGALVVGRAAVAHADPEHAVGSGHDVPAVVVRLGLRDREQLASTAAVGGAVGLHGYASTRVSPLLFVEST